MTLGRRAWATRDGPSDIDVTEYSNVIWDVSPAHQSEETNRNLAEQVASGRRYELEMRKLLSCLITVQEEERRRIARNLPDHLGQQMTAFHLQLAIVACTTVDEDHRHRPQTITGNTGARQATRQRPRLQYPRTTSGRLIQPREASCPRSLTDFVAALPAHTGATELRISHAGRA